VRAWIERRFQIFFGTFSTPPPIRKEFRIMFRVGAGAGRENCLFEAGIAGRNVYLERGERGGKK